MKPSKDALDEYKAMAKNSPGSMESKIKAQQRFFDEKKERVSNLPEDATEREKEFAKIALFMANYAEDLQMALNRVKTKQRTAATATECTKAERSKLRTDF